jgi:hypothetical protein
MSGILYIDEAAAEATTGHMLVTFVSGGEAFRFHLPGNVALKFRRAIIENTWQVCCVPNDVLPLKPKRKGKR